MRRRPELPRSRCYPERGWVSEILRRVLIEDCSKEDPSSNKCLEKCYHNGWLQAELTSADIGDGRIVYVFPSRIHKRYIYLLSSMGADTYII